MLSRVGALGMATIALMAFAMFSLEIFPSHCWGQGPEIVTSPALTQGLANSTADSTLPHPCSIQTLDTFTKLMKHDLVGSDGLMPILTPPGSGESMSPRGTPQMDEVPTIKEGSDRPVVEKFGGDKLPGRFYSFDDWISGRRTWVSPEPWFHLE
ncbi:MAG: hypothetical protein SWE60_13490 [Thermodesulfobacteriota bacterium]|nr:hypothetical protein [Thermodesulfobacteriota bacterium]